MSAELFGKKMGFVPYIMPGFALAKAAAEVFEQDPTVEGLILDKHGIFTFGDTAKEAYDRMIHYVTVAEDHVKTNGRNPFTPAALPASLASPPTSPPCCAVRSRSTGRRPLRPHGQCVPFVSGHSRLRQRG